MKLPEEELKKIDRQYDTLSETIFFFKKNMNGKQYRKNFSRQQRKQISHQLRFYKKALNSTVQCLIENDRLSPAISYCALRNPSIRIKVKLQTIKYRRQHGYTKRF